MRRDSVIGARYDVLGWGVQRTGTILTRASTSTRIFKEQTKQRRMLRAKGKKRELVDASRQGEVEEVQVDGDGEADVADNGRDGEGMDDFRGGGRGKYANVDGEVPLAMKTDRTGRGCLKRNYRQGGGRCGGG